jgi:hypothetical protein
MEINGRGDSLRWPRDTRRVLGQYSSRLRTQAMEFVSFLFEVFMTVTVKFTITVFRGNTLLQNVSTGLPDYVALNPRRQ